MGLCDEDKVRGRASKVEGHVLYAGVTECLSIHRRRHHDKSAALVNTVDAMPAGDGLRCPVVFSASEPRWEARGWFGTVLMGRREARRGSCSLIRAPTGVLYKPGRDAGKGLDMQMGDADEGECR